MIEDLKEEKKTAAQLPDLEIVCAACGGRGARSRGQEPCGLCDGSGYELTEFGEKVLSLTRHRFRPLFRELVSGE